jgi:hypothetical protein
VSLCIVTFTFQLQKFKAGDSNIVSRHCNEREVKWFRMKYSYGFREYVVKKSTVQATVKVDDNVIKGQIPGCVVINERCCIRGI